MAVRTREEIMASVRARVGEATDDATLDFIADISDTLTSLENSVVESGNWKKKYEDNDADWRRKYRDRFLSGEPAVEEPIEPPRNKIKTFEELFK